MKWKILIPGMFLSLWLVACGTTGQTTSAQKTCPGKEMLATAENKALKTHPSLSEEEKLLPCASCHRDVTPEIYEEWYKSRHGLDNVKCFQCHGTYENFEVIPAASRCMPCHAREVSSAPQDKNCAACHPAHKFSVHK